MVYSTPTPTSSSSSPSRHLTNLPLLQVSASPFHTIILTHDGIALTAGWAGHDQLGQSSLHSSTNERVPFSRTFTPVDYGTPPPLPHTVIASVACGTYHSILATSTGRVFSFGDNSSLQLGYTELSVISNYSSTSSDRRHSLNNISVKNTFTNPIPTLIPDLTDVSSVAAGADFSVALTSAGKVFAWGANDHNQLALPATTFSSSSSSSPVPFNSASPIRTPTPETTFSAISCGEAHLLLLTTLGSVFSSGLFTHGRLGIGASSSKPPAPLNKITEFDRLGIHVKTIIAGSASSAALDHSGNCYTFGYNGAAQLCHGNSTPCSVPKKVKNHRIVSISFGENHAAFLDDNFLVWCVGRNNSGRLGLVDAICDAAGSFITDCVVVNDDDDDDDLFADTATASAAATTSNNDDERIAQAVFDAEAFESTFATPYPSSNPDDLNDTFAKAMRELDSSSSPLISLPVCIGPVTEGDKITAVSCGAANTFAYTTASSKPAPRPDLVPCKYKTFGCRGKLLTPVISLHENMCPYRVEPCPFMCHGCVDDRVPFSLFDDHIKNCDFRQVVCDHCKASLSYFNMHNHLEDVCQSIPVPCDYCGEVIERREMPNHLEEICTECKIMCPNRCSPDEIRRGDVESHLLTCPRRLVACGKCTAEVPLDFLERHENNCDDADERPPSPSPVPPTRERPRRTGGGFAIKEKSPSAKG
jgi:alpha-tubulin suppressor-like RCC1 family protein